MPEYLLEFYVSASDPDLAAEPGRSVQEAAKTLSSRGTPVHYRRSMFVSADETYFVLLEAASADVVRETARLAKVSCDRIAAVSHPTDHRESS
ncbi:MAG TPA: hypothetical protein VMD48_07005 [Solirubrobacteraceae bacterium]|nr:hypothetical protein [Solirubrobacteraceae bacterium]